MSAVTSTSQPLLQIVFFPHKQERTDNMLMSYIFRAFTPISIF